MRRILSALAAAGIALVIASCGDSAIRPTSPSGLSAPGAQQAVVPGTCTTLAELTTLTNTVFSGNGPNANSALSKLNNVDKKLKKNDLAGAQSEARNLVSFIQLKASQGHLGGTPAQVQSLISGILCYAGLLSDTFLILPSDQPQTIKHPSGLAGVQLPANPVGTATLLTIVLLDPNGPSPLITKLDKYPSYVELQVSSPLTKPAIVAVCPSTNVPSSVRPHLRLGHQATAGFELTPAADGSFLQCTPPTSSTQSSAPSWLKRLASLVTPRSLYAQLSFVGGVGGVATEFSPFGAVDTELGFTGGVGGTSTEFTRTRGGPTVSGTPNAARIFSGTSTSGTFSSLTCPVVQATAGTPLAPECRPVVTITTHNGTIMQNVPVSWAVTQGGGTIAPSNQTTSICGTFGSNASTSTDLLGKAGVCWTLGTTAGTNIVTATPGAGGDAPAGVTFTPAGVTFTATGTKITPTVTAAGGTFPYDAVPHAGSGTCSNALVPALTYSSGSVPVNAGNYTLTVTCGGGAQYNVASTTAPIVISQLPATATAASGTMLFNGAVPALGCAVSGLLASESGLVTCTASVTPPIVPGANVVNAVASPGSPTNYAVQLVNGTLTARYRPDACFAMPLMSSLPPLSSAITKGTVITLRCTIKDGQNVSVANPGGNLVVSDLGLTGTDTPVQVLALASPFNFVNPSQLYSLDTSPAGFVADHYYKVTTQWNDGSTTTSYFLLKARI